jgi:hypothetical protein
MSGSERQAGFCDEEISLAENQIPVAQSLYRLM